MQSPCKRGLSRSGSTGEVHFIFTLGSHTHTTPRVHHSSSGGYSRRWSRGWGTPRCRGPGSPAGWPCTASRTRRPCAWHTRRSCTSGRRSCRGCSPAGPPSSCTAWLRRQSERFVISVLPPSIDRSIDRSLAAWRARCATAEPLQTHRGQRTD